MLCHGTKHGVHVRSRMRTPPSLGSPPKLLSPPGGVKARGSGSWPEPSAGSAGGGKGGVRRFRPHEMVAWRRFRELVSGREPGVQGEAQGMSEALFDEGRSM